MGFWSAIKYAVNSSLGTDEFQPIDQIVKGQRGLVASDNVYAILYSGNMTIGQNAQHDLFVAQWSGSLSIGLAGTNQGVLRIFKNGNEIAPNEQTNTEKGLYVFGSINIEKGDRITLVGAATNATASITQIAILADMTDLSAFDILLEV